ncbi:MAG: tetratricopeptide repeat protein [Sulfuricella sp.]
MAAKQAIDAGNKEQAEAMLGQLAAHLPPESVTILRLRAWQALRNNDQSRAMTLYGQIVERLPDDESASINLAVLNWKAGQQDEARRIVGMLAERRPDSETVRRYVAQFGERR